MGRHPAAHGCGGGRGLACRNERCKVILVISYAHHCAYCGDEIGEREGRWCDGCADAARHDNLAPVSSSMTRNRRMRRLVTAMIGYLTRLIEYLDEDARQIKGARR